MTPALRTEVDGVRCKARDPLAALIATELKSRGLGPTAGARFVGVAQGLMSDLYAGKYRDISVDRCAKALSKLGYRVELSAWKLEMNSAGSPRRGTASHTAD